jgi:hypothetical protein
MLGFELAAIVLLLGAQVIATREQAAPGRPLPAGRGKAR